MKPNDPARLAVTAEAVKSALGWISAMRPDIMDMEFTEGSTQKLTRLVSVATQIKALLELADSHLFYLRCGALENK